eukprot:3240086-Prymnesium_polylepis.1
MPVGAEWTRPHARARVADDHGEQGDLGAQADPRAAAEQGLHRRGRAQDAALRPPHANDRPGAGRRPLIALIAFIATSC